MTVHSSNAKHRTVVVRRKSTKPISRQKLSPPKLPVRPKVLLGPKSYGRTKSGKAQIVIRFYVSKYPALSLARVKRSKWFVFDMESGTVAKGTQADGYSEKIDAIKVAKEYREEFGAYTRSQF